MHALDSTCFTILAWSVRSGKLKLRWQSMHETNRPWLDIKIPMRWEEEETTLTDIAPFDSLVYKTTIRSYRQQVVN